MIFCAAKRLAPRFQLQCMLRDGGLLADVHSRKVPRPRVQDFNVPSDRERALGVMSPRALFREIDFSGIGF